MTLLAAVLLVGGNASASERAGDVVALRGEVLVEREPEVLPAAVQFVLLEDDSVVTREQARVKMLFRDDSILTLGPLSRLVVKQYLYSPEQKRADSIYELLDGKLRAVVGNARLKVVTPTAYAAARGTIFIVWYDPERQMTGVAVLEGEVEVGNIRPDTGEGRLIRAGQMTFVYTGEPPIDPLDFEPGPGGEAGGVVGDVTLDTEPEVIQPPAAGDENPPDGYLDFTDITAPPVSQEPVPERSTVSIDLVFQ